MLVNTARGPLVVQKDLVEALNNGRIFAAGLAALNLAIDFDFIERGAKQGLPKGMEWFGALALVVTLVWLYLELLRLLSNLQRR